MELLKILQQKYKTQPRSKMFLPNQSQSSRTAKTQKFIFKESVGMKTSIAQHRLHLQQQYEICHSTMQNALCKVRFKNGVIYVSLAFHNYITYKNWLKNERAM